MRLPHYSDRHILRQTVSLVGWLRLLVVAKRYVVGLQLMLNVVNSLRKPSPRNSVVTFSTTYGDPLPGIWNSGISFQNSGAFHRITTAQCPTFASRHSVVNTVRQSQLVDNTYRRPTSMYWDIQTLEIMRRMFLSCSDGSYHQNKCNSQIKLIIIYQILKKKRQHSCTPLESAFGIIKVSENGRIRQIILSL